MMNCSKGPLCKGILLVLFGVLAMLDTLQVFPGLIETYWPVVLILVGVHEIMCSSRGGGVCKMDECCEEKSCGMKKK